ncbi:unnamed protein product [Spodoptera littoralis]|uniref:Uncharacterized protein n=1 Tax=Spodoptera littoralis TaxID=7109 RepID=A0A9P0IA84_SPOLI|nr:unnamed protein product [Spodoptera littoralis]CAH1643118.1 unnamed protein product [Spodoptera littoralis]
MSFFENITLRRRRTNSDSNLINSSQFSTSTHNDDNSMGSMPDLSVDADNEQITQLKQRIQNLEQELKSAHLEIESLSLENSSLKQTNDELLRKNKFYNTISCSPRKKNTPNKPVQTKTKKGKMKSANTQTTMYPMSPVLTESCDDANSKHTATDHLRKTYPVTQTQNKLTKKLNTIHIVSSNKKNKILTIAENTFPDKYKLCHYLLPNSNTEQLIKNIEIKLHGMTMNDFCVLMIGEEDFNTTKDYIYIISKLKQTLQRQKFTNIIICAPTYKCGSHIGSMYNWRVQNFNNKLYLDVLQYEYAYFLDTNKNLRWGEMFHKTNGTVNNYGMSIIFKDVIDFITGISEELTASSNDQCSNNQESQGVIDCTFFRE